MSYRSQKVFTEVHKDGILNKRITVSFSRRVRTRIWHCLREFNLPAAEKSYSYSTWKDESDIETEVKAQLPGLYGLDKLEASKDLGESEFHSFFMDTYPSRIFDIIQLWYRELDDKEHKFAFQTGLNHIFDAERVNWCFCDGLFFQLDPKFFEENIYKHLEELVRINEFHGAREEFHESRQDLASEDFKGAIVSACKAYESLMKSMLGVDSGTVSDLARRIEKSGYLDTLPNDLKSVFVEKVMQVPAIIRNKAGAHGQGKNSITIHQDLAELAVNLSGALMLYLIRCETRRKPQTKPSEDASSLSEDDIPF